MKHIDIDKIVDEYRDSCIQYDRASKANDHKAVNKFHDKIINSYLQLKDLKRVDALEKLLFLQEDGVRAWAATHLLNVNESLAKQVLLEISDQSNLLGFDAQMTLSEWEKGNLKLNYENYKVKW